MLPSIDTIFLFITTSTIVCLIPGPSVLFAITKTATQGLKIGLKSVGGLQFGFFLQVIAATFGLSAIILSSAIVFKTIKIMGALYLIYIGFSILVSKNDPNSVSYDETRTQQSPFMQGIFVDLLNPKIAIFFISYIPQFINNAGPPIGQLFFYGAFFCLIGTITNIFYVFLIWKAARKFKNIKENRYFNKWIPGSIFIGLGLRLAIEEK